MQLVNATVGLKEVLVHHVFLLLGVASGSISGEIIQANRVNCTFLDSKTRLTLSLLVISLQSGSQFDDKINCPVIFLSLSAFYSYIYILYRYS